MNQVENIKTPTAATIAAVSTPAGISALAVIRISGPEAADCCQLLFSPLGKKFFEPLAMPGYTLAYGNWYATAAKQELIDKVVLSCFRAPHSYTGEDVFEISCHGSLYGTQAILDSLYAVGVAPAGPGDFSKRAFVNGKLDLTEAEAVIDLIETEARERSKYALRQLQGTIHQLVGELSSALYAELSRLELMLEFPEFEDGAEVRSLMLSNLQSVAGQAEQLSEGYRQGRMIREGIRVALIGKPNAGKSTLFNDLLLSDRAIVTDIPGTTRDTIEGRLIVDGLVVTLVDTAGLREALDPVEQAGIERSRQAIKSADQVLWLLDATDEEAEIVRQAEEIAKLEGTVIALLSRCDLVSQDQVQHYRKLVTTHTGRQPLCYIHGDSTQLASVSSCLLEAYRKVQTAESEVITNVRHSNNFRSVAELLTEAMGLIRQDMPLELVAGLLRAALDKLAEITGEQVTETLIDNIFSRFCVGK